MEIEMQFQLIDIMKIWWERIYSYWSSNPFRQKSFRLRSEAF